jgi:hypothetical protein
MSAKATVIRVEIPFVARIVLVAIMLAAASVAWLRTGELTLLFPARIHAAQTGPAVKQDDKADSKDGTPSIVVKRRSLLSDEDLRKQLLAVPEIGFNQVGAASLYANLQQFGGAGTPPDIGMKFFAKVVCGSGQLSPMSMPWQNGLNGQLGKEKAERLQVLSTCLRDCLRASVPAGDIRPDPEKLRELLLSIRSPDKSRGRGFGGGFGGASFVEAAEWKKAQALPTLTQMMQAENSPVRELMVEMVGAIKGKEAGTFLAHRAIFDLSLEVRAKAVQELATRPTEEYQQALLYGLQYPWPAAADHAAEAIGALQLTTLLPGLVNLLKQPDPSVPTKSEKGYVVREVVRVNHLCNCMLCHPPSSSTEDLVRGRVPVPGEDPPPAYYQAATGTFVRADLTYLRQDFSVVQPVPNAGKWPANQRYDYIIRVRPPTKSEMRLARQAEKDPALPKAYPQREAVLAALRQLTKADAGETYDKWNGELPKLLKALRVEGEKK